jgi:endoglucanase
MTRIVGQISGSHARAWRSRLAALFCLALPLAARAQDFNGFHHGVAIHDAMNWATMDKSKKLYVFPPYSDAKHPLTQNELAVIRHAGFDFVRLTVDPGPFLQFQGAQLDATYEILRQRVQTVLDAGLAVVVDFHPAEQDPDYGSRALVAGPDTPLFASYCTMITRTARLLDALHTDRVALETMNEPVIGGTPSADAQWQTMAEKLYHSARAASPTLTLIVAGDLAGDYQGLQALDPAPFAADPRTIYTFHYYLPYLFTYQSMSKSNDLRTAADIPYPARTRPVEDSVAALRVRLDKSGETDRQKVTDANLEFKNLVQYRQANFGRGNIRDDFGKVAAWARASGIAPSRIFLGEFNAIRKYGPYDGAPDADRARWLKDVREEAEAEGFFWSIWAYRGYGGMAIVENDNTDTIDPVTLQAIGLH